jgi:PiT family inorganic phosphate transporter
MVISPIVGLLLGYAIMLSLIWALRGVALPLINRWFGRFQIVSAGFMALSHGSNDAQKSMGIIALAIATFFHTPFGVPLWVKLACAAAMGLGTMSGGWKIIRTMGSKMIKLQPIHGFAAETTAGSIILVASQWGIPLSTTHVISTAIMGVGATRRLSAVKWGIVGRIIWAWVLTLPLTFLLSGGLYSLYRYFSGS